MFKTYQSAAVLTGCIAGFVYTIATDPESRHAGWMAMGIAYALIAPFALLVTSAIAERSWVSLVAAAVLLIPVSFVCNFWSMFFMLNGRESLPLVVWGAPFQAVSVPGPHGDWRIQALLNFAGILTIFALGQMVIRWGLNWRAVNGKAIVFGLAVLPGLVLYVASWQAKLSGTFAYALFTPTQYYTSLAAYFAIFPVSTWWLHFLANKFAVRGGDTPCTVKPYNNVKRSTSEHAPPG